MHPQPDAATGGNAAAPAHRLSDPARKALELVVEFDQAALVDEFRNATPDGLVRLAEQAQLLARVSEAATSGEITVVDALAIRPKIAEHLAHVCSSQGYEREKRELYLAGEDGWGYDGRDVEATLACYQRNIDMYAQETAWCDAFLCEAPSPRTAGVEVAA